MQHNRPRQGPEVWPMLCRAFLLEPATTENVSHPADPAVLSTIRYKPQLIKCIKLAGQFKLLHCGMDRNSQPTTFIYTFVGKRKSNKTFNANWNSKSGPGGNMLGQFGGLPPAAVQPLLPHPPLAQFDPGRTFKIDHAQIFCFSGQKPPEGWGHQDFQQSFENGCPVPAPCFPPNGNSPPFFTPNGSWPPPSQFYSPPQIPPPSPLYSPPQIPPPSPFYPPPQIPPPSPFYSPQISPPSPFYSPQIPPPSPPYSPQIPLPSFLPLPTPIRGSVPNQFMAKNMPPLCPPPLFPPNGHLGIGNQAPGQSQNRIGPGPYQSCSIPFMRQHQGPANDGSGSRIAQNFKQYQVNKGKVHKAKTFKNSNGHPQRCIIPFNEEDWLPDSTHVGEANQFNPKPTSVPAQSSANNTATFPHPWSNQNLVNVTVSKFPKSSSLPAQKCDSSGSGIIPVRISTGSSYNYQSNVGPQSEANIEKWISPHTEMTSDANFFKCEVDKTLNSTNENETEAKLTGGAIKPESPCATNEAKMETPRPFLETVSHIHEEYGYVGVEMDIFFETSLLGRNVKLAVGDKVFGVADAVQNMPFKWKCFRIEKYQQPNSKISKLPHPPPPPPIISVRQPDYNYKRKRSKLLQKHSQVSARSYKRSSRSFSSRSRSRSRSPEEWKPNKNRKHRRLRHDRSTSESSDSSDRDYKLRRDTGKNRRVQTKRCPRSPLSEESSPVRSGSIRISSKEKKRMPRLLDLTLTSFVKEPLLKSPCLKSSAKKKKKKKKKCNKGRLPTFLTWPNSDYALQCGEKSKLSPRESLPEREELAENPNSSPELPKELEKNKSDRIELPDSPRLTSCETSENSASSIAETLLPKTFTVTLEDKNIDIRAGSRKPDALHSLTKNYSSDLDLEVVDSANTISQTTSSNPTASNKPANNESLHEILEKWKSKYVRNPPLFDSKASGSDDGVWKDCLYGPVDHPDPSISTSEESDQNRSIQLQLDPPSPSKIFKTPSNSEPTYPLLPRTIDLFNHFQTLVPNPHHRLDMKAANKDIQKQNNNKSKPKQKAGIFNNKSVQDEALEQIRSKWTSFRIANPHKIVRPSAFAQMKKTSSCGGNNEMTTEHNRNSNNTELSIQHNSSDKSKYDKDKSHESDSDWYSKMYLVPGQLHNRFFFIDDSTARDLDHDHANTPPKLNAASNRSQKPRTLDHPSLYRFRNMRLVPGSKMAKGKLEENGRESLQNEKPESEISEDQGSPNCCFDVVDCPSCGDAGKALMLLEQPDRN